MGDKPEILLIDINVLAFESLRECTYQDHRFGGRPTGAIHGTLDKLSTLIRNYPTHIPIVLWDDRCYWREEILECYKRHRYETPEQRKVLAKYFAQIPIVRQLLGHIGIPQLTAPGTEADDLAGVICRGIDQDWAVVLATSDQDWYQALRSNVEWYSPLRGARVALSDLQDPQIVRGGPFASTDHYIQAKALAGDSSDGIPGVWGLGIKMAAAIIAQYGSVEALWYKHDNGTPVKGARLERVVGPDCRASFPRNLRLIDWRLGPRLSSAYRFQLGSRDEQAYADKCRAWGLASPYQLVWPGLGAADQSANVLDAIEQVLAAST